jgi:hypothetical protein
LRWRQGDASLYKAAQTMQELQRVKHFCSRAAFMFNVIYYFVKGVATVKERRQVEIDVSS